MFLIPPEESIGARSPGEGRRHDTRRAENLNLEAWRLKHKKIATRANRS
jgi:hypothetical protein